MYVLHISALKKLLGQRPVSATFCPFLEICFTAPRVVAFVSQITMVLMANVDPIYKIRIKIKKRFMGLKFMSLIEKFFVTHSQDSH